MQINECLTIKIQFVSATSIGDYKTLDTKYRNQMTLRTKIFVVQNID